MHRDPCWLGVNPIGPTRRHTSRRCCSSRMLVEGSARVGMALAAAGRDAQCEPQFIGACATRKRGAGDVAVGDSVADTNDHASTLMRTRRISNRGWMSGQLWGLWVRKIEGSRASLPLRQRPATPCDIRAKRRAEVSKPDLGLKVVFLADLAHQFQLCIQEIDVLFGVPPVPTGPAAPTREKSVRNEVPMLINKQPMDLMPRATSSADMGAPQGARRATGDAPVSAPPFGPPGTDSEVVPRARRHTFTKGVGAVPACPFIAWPCKP